MILRKASRIQGARPPLRYLGSMRPLFSRLDCHFTATSVQAYLSYSLRAVGAFTTFQSNMLTVVSAAVQVITMLALSKSSQWFNERTWHCFFGEFWVLPCLIALQTLPGSQKLPWERFALATLVSGYPSFYPILSAWLSRTASTSKAGSDSGDIRCQCPG